MIYLFEIPEILDNAILPKLVKNDLVTAKQYNFLSETQNLRENFKNMVSFKSFTLIQNNQTMVAFQDKLDQYLKTNVDMMYILASQPSYSAMFKYKTFLSKTPEHTTSDNNEEACASEIVMCRFGYAFLFCLDAFHDIKYIREKMTTSFLNNNLANEEFIFQIGWQPLKKMYNVMPDILKSLIKKKNEDLLPEFKGEVIRAIKIVLEINTNSLYIEQLRLLQSFNEIAMVCKGSVEKLELAAKILTQEKNIKAEVLNFCYFASNYFKSYGFWALLKVNENLIKAEDYKKKNFIVLTKEVISISKYLINTYSNLKKNVLDEDYYEFSLELFKSCFVPISEHYLKIYVGIHHDKSPEPNPEEIFAQITQTLDFLETN